MHRRRLGALLAGSLPLALAGCQTDRTDDETATNDTTSGIPDFTTEEQAAAEALDPDWPTGPYAAYETTPVVVRGADGGVRGAVVAAVADTPDKRRLGLSAAESMPSAGGMLFTYESVGDHTYVMRDMSFGLDIIYATADGEITEIHNAPEPGPDENGAEQTYPGRGQYVFEVNRNWTADNNVSVGDRLVFER
jgi:uncharacterized membrane protein (UPF0127 family)